MSNPVNHQLRLVACPLTGVIHNYTKITSDPLERNFIFYRESGKYTNLELGDTTASRDLSKKSATHKSGFIDVG